MMKVLLTGVNGFVGVHLAQLLNEKGMEVWGIGTKEHSLLELKENFHYEKVDYLDLENLDRFAQKVRPDVVVHSGAISNADECEKNKELAYRANVTGTQHLLQVAATYGAHFIFLSTDFVFDGKKGMYTELDERAPVNYYGFTKMKAEDEVMHYAHTWSIVRTVMVYGKALPNRNNIVTMVAQALRDGKSLRMFNDQVRTPTYVFDLARALCAIIEKKAAGTYHISGEEVFTPYSLATTIAEQMNLSSQNIESIVADQLKEAAKRPLKTGFTIDKAKQDLKYQPTPFHQSFREIMEAKPVSAPFRI